MPHLDLKAQLTLGFTCRSLRATAEANPDVGTARRFLNLLVQTTKYNDGLNNPPYDRFDERIYDREFFNRAKDFLAENMMEEVGPPEAPDDETLEMAPVIEYPTTASDDLRILVIAYIDAATWMWYRLWEWQSRYDYLEEIRYADTEEDYYAKYDCYDDDGEDDE